MEFDISVEVIEGTISKIQKISVQGNMFLSFSIDATLVFVPPQDEEQALAEISEGLFAMITVIQVKGQLFIYSQVVT